MRNRQATKRNELVLGSAVVALLAGCAPGQTSVSTQATPTPTAAPPALSGSYLFFEDFEHGITKWTLPSPGPVGWRQLKSASCGGDYTALFGADQQATFSSVTTTSDLTLAQPIDLTKAMHPWLTYQLLGTSDPASALTIEAQIDAGDGNWQTVGQTAQGSYAQMGTLVVNLAPYVGKKVGLRFHAESQATATSGKGLQLDDIAVIEDDSTGGN